MITRYLPTFKQIEPELLYGLTSGYVVAQLPVAFTSPSTYSVATVSKGDYKFIENGVICGINDDGKVVNYTTGQAFIHFTEESNTFIDEKQYFAVEVAENETFLRLVGLHVGDQFITNNYTVISTTEAAGAVAVDSTHPARYAIVSNGILNIYNTLPTANATGLAFAVEAATLPKGDSAYRFTMVRA